MTNFLFFVLGLMVGGLTGITMMCLCTIAKKADEHIEKENYVYIYGNSNYYISICTYNG